MNNSEGAASPEVGAEAGASSGPVILPHPSAPIGTLETAAAQDSEDLRWVAASVAGDAQAFEQLFVKYRQRVFAVSWRLLRDEDAALDVVQDAFVRAFEELGNLRGETRFFPWLRRIAVNLSIDRLRQLRRSKEVSLFAHTAGEDEDGREEIAAATLGSANSAASMVQQENSPLNQAEVSELSSALSLALLKLSDSHRAVFMLHAAEGMSYKEIADALGCNIGTVMSRLFYARKRLQELLSTHLSPSGPRANTMEA